MESFIDFHNPLAEDFTFRWDKNPITVKAGDTVRLQNYLAKHGAKHLTNHIIQNSGTWQKLGLTRNSSIISVGREEILDILLPDAKPKPKEEPKDVVPPVPQPEEKPKEKEFEELEEKVSEVAV